MYNKTLSSLFIFVLFAFSSGRLFAQNKQFADSWEYMGIAVEEPGFTIWGTSPVMDDEGNVHLFVARWPGDKVNPDWRSASEIAHYVGSNPEGPFSFSDVAVAGTGLDTWDKYGAHNPTISRVEDKYVLLYIANDNPSQPPHPSNQKIGMAIADSPYGPWNKVNKDGLILDTPKNPAYWNYEASNGVNNPALLKHPDGEYFIYFKSEKSRMGLAIAENLEGPYVQMPFPVTSNDQNIEDGYAFMYEGKFALLTTDNHGIIEAGGGLLWTSEDGITFDTYEKGFHRINAYLDFDQENVAIYYGPMNATYSKFERPQLLLVDGEVNYMYVPSGHNIFGRKNTVSYVLKFKK
ncbi:glycoside hydrolase family protein [Algoriphagus aquimarinus]|uniref:glycoside hydrolase family protein n=1 Tax=Algoriphagus aquimarinus TaxID=237018 RepID=UPI0030D96CF7|tara:strand:- start:102697 stop:103743 length:1047 start_codon:yes stop_codon:yes gene_type:complete